LFEGHEFRDIETSVVEEIELALQVKIEQAFRSAMRCDDAVSQAGFLGGFRELGPIFVVANFGRRRKRDGKTRATARVFHLEANTTSANCPEVRDGSSLATVRLRERE